MITHPPAHSADLRSKVHAMLEGLKAGADRYLTAVAVRSGPQVVEMPDKTGRLEIHPRLAESRTANRYTLPDGKVALLKPPDVVHRYDADGRFQSRTKVGNNPPELEKWS